MKNDHRATRFADSGANRKTSADSACSGEQRVTTSWFSFTPELHNWLLTEPRPSASEDQHGHIFDHRSNLTRVETGSHGGQVMVPLRAVGLHLGTRPWLRMAPEGTPPG